MKDNTCITDNLPKECAINFKILEVKLNTIRNNDLVHIEKRLNELTSWVKALLIVFAGGFLGILLNVVF